MSEFPQDPPFPLDDAVESAAAAWLVKHDRGLDAGEQDALGYIAMELVEGQSLKEWSRKPNLMPLQEVVQTLVSVAEALD